MLTGLRLENIALIERLQLEFSAGLTVLTGETGAGKSLLLDALDALLGGAAATAGPRLLRQGAGRGLIEATFGLTPPLQTWLEQQQLEAEDGEVLLSREWRLTEGRLNSRHRLNGVAVNRAQILELRPLLLDLTVQGQTQQLARPGQQRRWLDRFGGEAVQQCLAPVPSAHRHWKQAAAALEGRRPTGANWSRSGSGNSSCWRIWKQPSWPIQRSGRSWRWKKIAWPTACGCRRGDDPVGPVGGGS